MGDQYEFTWVTRNSKRMKIYEMTDSHIKNAWAYMFRSNFGISDGQMKAFEVFRLELKRRHQWNLKLELQYKGLKTRNVMHHVIEVATDYDIYNDEFF